MKMKKIFSMVLVVAALAGVVAGCADSGDTSPTSTGASRETQASYSTAITVYMPIEYVDTSVLRDFEKEFNVGITLEEFDSNESMYDDIKDSNEYDVLVPSDYMVDRLIQEDKLAKLDHSRLPNLSYLAPQYMGPDYDKENSYHAPYMVGTLGILYNRRTLQIDSWEDMFSTEGILLADSERDVLGVALKMLGYSMNTADDSEIESAKQVLQSAKSKIRGFYETTEIVDIITAQEAFVGVVYSGDGKMAVDLNSNLAYIIPEGGSNKWTDAFVIPANSQHIDLAHEFINFMCRPNIAIRNMSTLGYTSPVSDAWSEFAGDKIMFPSDEELARCETFSYSPQIAEKYYKAWSDIRGN